MSKSLRFEIPIAKAIALCKKTEVTENLDFRLALDAWLWGAHFLSRRGRLSMQGDQTWLITFRPLFFFFSLMSLNLTDEDYQ